MTANKIMMLIKTSNNPSFYSITNIISVIFGVGNLKGYVYAYFFVMVRINNYLEKPV